VVTPSRWSKSRSGRSSAAPTLASAVARPVREFLATEVSGGLVLLGAAVVALVWANSPWQTSYRTLWSTNLSLGVGGYSIDGALRLWVNEGLMTIFFLVVGLEIRRELASGDLRDRRRAALPVLAAAGGMLVPALLYLVVNAGGRGARGWGIPMATDIAFSLGVVALLGRRVPSSLRLFLLTLAVADDLGALVVLVAFYSTRVSVRALLVAVALVVLVVLLKRVGVRWSPLFVGLGVAIWLALREAGVNPTLAGVAMGLLAPVEPALPEHAVATMRHQLADVSTVNAARDTVRLARESVSVVEWLEHVLHPWASYVVVPVFALANAGVVIGTDLVEATSRSPVALGVLLGKVVGKALGITAFTWIACRLGLSSLPPDVRWRQVVGIGAVAGVGFTVSLFFVDLSFADPDLQDEAKLAVLVASAVAACLGALLLRGARRDEVSDPGDAG
jgi:Na+:H+ antiporter, NhaA family